MRKALDERDWAVKQVLMPYPYPNPQHLTLTPTLSLALTPTLSLTLTLSRYAICIVSGSRARRNTPTRCEVSWRTTAASTWTTARRR
eukprot:scaffold31736_cov36-Phaeocystis_antarctica.AAC.2